MRDSRKLDVIMQQQRVIMQTLRVMYERGERQMAWIDNLKDEVEHNSTVIKSAVALIGELAIKIQDLIDSGAEPADFQALVDELKASDSDLADAVAKNTPAEVPPAPVPVEDPAPVEDPKPVDAVTGDKTIEPVVPDQPDGPVEGTVPASADDATSE